MLFKYGYFQRARAPILKIYLSTDLSTATTFTADLTTAITTASTIIFTATDHTSTTHCKKHNKSPSLCTSSGCQEVLETRRPRTGMHSMKKMETMRI